MAGDDGGALWWGSLAQDRSGDSEAGAGGSGAGAGDCDLPGAGGHERGSHACLLCLGPASAEGGGYSPVRKNTLMRIHMLMLMLMQM